MMDGEAGENELIDGGGSFFLGNRFIGISTKVERAS